MSARAAHGYLAAWFVLVQLIGYDKVRNDDGSRTGYGSVVGVPAER